MTKTDVTNKLNQLKKYNFDVKTFNHRREVGRGSKGFIDHLVTSKTGRSMYWIEVKLGRDRERPEQKEFREMIERFEKRNVGIYHRQVTENNLEDVIVEIYGK